MTQIAPEYEYAYTDSSLTNAHSFLLSPLLSLLPQNPDSNTKKLRLLDLGCGNGSLSNVLAQQGYEVVGVEESAQGVEIAKRNFPSVNFVQGSIYNLPNVGLENSFDIAIAVAVIEHLFYPRDLVRAAKKYLKPNGRLILTTPDHGYAKNLVMALSGKMDKYFHVLWDGGYIKFFSIPTMTELLETEGYTDLNFKFAGRLPYLWKSMLCSCSPCDL